jgi:hypothetical protein
VSAREGCGQRRARSSMTRRPTWDARPSVCAWAPCLSTLGGSRRAAAGPGAERVEFANAAHCHGPGRIKLSGAAPR